jgi:hypothetical protein
MVKKRVCSFVIAMIAPVLCQVFPAFANEATDFGHIITFQTGSVGGPSSPGSVTNPRLIPGDDTVTVNLDVPFVNSGPPQGPLLHPTRCSITTGGYALDPKDNGTKLNESVLLSAYLAGKKVRLTLDGCVFSKPRIISVSMSTSVN